MRDSTRPPPLPPWLPSHSGVDPSELAELTPHLAAVRDQLEAELGCHVAAYRTGAVGRPGGLCDVYESARLADDQLQRLRAVESVVPGAILVAYTKPLRRRSIDS